MTKPNMNKKIITLIAGLSFATTGVTTVQLVKPQPAQASLIGKAFIITYLYKNRNTIKEMLQRAKTVTHTNALPKFHKGASANGFTQVLVETPHHRVGIGKYPTKMIDIIINGDNDVKTAVAHMMK